MDKLGFKIEIFVVDGNPQGLRLIEKSNWIGLGIVCPRGRYKQARERDEFLASGVYILIGHDEGSLPVLYVGESEQVRNRLDFHYTEKDFWQQVIIFTTQGPPLNKAQVKYLESRLLELAMKSGRSKLLNKVTPKPIFKEADKAVSEGYLRELLSLLPLLGVPFFELDDLSDNDRNHYFFKGKGYDAKGLEENTGFRVLKGSIARAKERPSMKKHTPGYFNLRQKLIADEILQKADGGYCFSRDHHFDSSSAAAAVCCGGATDGPTKWKDLNGNSLKDNRKKAIVEQKVMSGG